jgi:putative NADH-flavin reductase
VFPASASGGDVSVPEALLVLGGTGQTGRQVIEQALSRDLAVVALVRDRGRLPVQSGRLRVVTGTPVDGGTVREAMADCRAVVSALGISRRSAWPWAPVTSPPDLMLLSIGNTIDAMRERGVTRIVVVSAGGVGDSSGDMPRGFRWLVEHSRIGAAYQGHEDQERLLRESDMQWTVLRPSMLTNKPGSGQVLLSYGGRPQPRRSISRQTLAAALLDALDDPELVRRAPTVSER